MLLPRKLLHRAQPCIPGSLLLPTIPGTAGLGELEWAGANTTCSRLSDAFSEGFIYLRIYFAQSSSHPLACWVVSHQYGYTGTTQCHLEEQQWPVGLECHFVIKLDLRTHQFVMLTSSLTSILTVKQKALHTGQGQGDGPQAVLSILVCLRAPCLHRCPCSFPAAGVGRCSAGLCY